MWFCGQGLGEKTPRPGASWLPPKHPRRRSSEPASAAAYAIHGRRSRHWPVLAVLWLKPDLAGECEDSPVHLFCQIAKPGYLGLKGIGVL